MSTSSLMNDTYVKTQNPLWSVLVAEVRCDMVQSASSADVGDCRIGNVHADTVLAFGTLTTVSTNWSGHDAVMSGNYEPDYGQVPSGCTTDSTVPEAARVNAASDIRIPFVSLFHATAEWDGTCTGPAGAAINHENLGHFVGNVLSPEGSEPFDLQQTVTQHVVEPWLKADASASALYTGDDCDEESSVGELQPDAATGGYMYKQADMSTDGMSSMQMGKDSKNTGAMKTCPKGWKAESAGPDAALSLEHVFDVSHQEQADRHHVNLESNVFAGCPLVMVDKMGSVSRTVLVAVDEVDVDTGTHYTGGAWSDLTFVGGASMVKTHDSEFPGMSAVGTMTMFVDTCCTTTLKHNDNENCKEVYCTDSHVMMFHATAIDCVDRVADACPLKSWEGKVHWTVASDHAPCNHRDSNPIDGETLDEKAVDASSENSKEESLTCFDNVLWQWAAAKNRKPETVIGRRGLPCCLLLGSPPVVVRGWNWLGVFVGRPRVVLSLGAPPVLSSPWVAPVVVRGWNWLGVFVGRPRVVLSLGAPLIGSARLGPGAWGLEPRVFGSRALNPGP